MLILQPSEATLSFLDAVKQYGYPLLGIIAGFATQFGLSARRSRVIAEAKERVAFVQAWRSARQIDESLSEDDAQSINSELKYAFSEVKRSRISREHSRDGVNYLKKWLLLYDLLTIPARVFKSIIIVYTFAFTISLLYLEVTSYNHSNSFSDDLKIFYNIALQLSGYLIQIFLLGVFANISEEIAQYKLRNSNKKIVKRLSPPL